MKLLYKMSLLLALGVVSMNPLQTSAQYCAPAVTTGGLYFSYIAFDVANVGFTGTHYNTVSSGYTQTVGSPSGTTHRYFGGGMYYGIYNPANTAISYDFATYIDWNNDGDFNDANELSYVSIGSVPALSSSTTGAGIIPPLWIPAGNYRLRAIVRQGNAGTPAACGTFTGEVEDYVITIAANVAPVLKTTATPKLNSIFNTQTNSNGFAINELIGSTEPADTLILDSDDFSANFGSKVPRGIAIYAQTANNGVWQYKVGTGAWTDVGTLSTSNALLLMADAGSTNYQPGSRLRFVPTGVGTPSISFKAWDATTGTNGGYASVATTGGTTAFSTANQTSTLSVIANTGYTSSVYFITGNNTIYNSSMNRTTKAIGNPEALLTGSGSYTGYDIDVDPISNKLFWINPTQDTIYTSNTDGTAPAVLVTGLTYTTGLAMGNGKLYYSTFSSDYSAFQIYKINTNGSNNTMIYSSSAISDSKDLEFYNNKLYVQYGDASSIYHIGTIDTLGAALTTLYNAPASTYFSGMNVTADTIYWSETNGTIKKRAINNTTVTTLLTAAGRTMNDMVVDPVTSTIYFTDNDINSNDRYTNIRRISTTGGAATTVNTVTNTVYSLVFNNSNSIPLPIALSDFEGHYDAASASALLNWETSSEQNNIMFILERSTDAKQFSAIATVKGSGTTATVNNYKYNDNLAAVKGNVFYYRLQQVDNSGQASYSKTVAIYRGVIASAITLWPNPSQGYFNIHLSNTPSKPVTVMVYSNDGRLVKSMSVNAQDATLDLSAQQAGIYMLQINLGDSQQQMTVVKQ